MTPKSDSSNQSDLLIERSPESFPKMNTMPSGWDLSDVSSGSASSTKTNDHQYQRELGSKPTDSIL